VARSRSPLRGLLIAWKAFSYTLGALVLAFVIAQAWFFGHVLYLTRFEPASTAFMDRALEQLRERNPRARLEHRWVPYPRISLSLKRAVVAAEDARFLDHEGFDWESIQKAIAKNERRGRLVAGASTISQQLAKNLFLSGERSWLRKGQEAIITWMLETVMSKRRILELYLNVAEWGDGVFGAEAAARHHFGVPAAALSAEQAAWLAAILPSPHRYDHGRLTPYLAGRVDTILSRMPGAQIPAGEPR
jgi:monofunctional biosynthetic peptidoglycan transglycosylase